MKPLPALSLSMGHRPESTDSLEKVAPRLACGIIRASASKEARSMMGQLSSGQERLFYSLNLEDHISVNHLLRSIDRCMVRSSLLRLALRS